MSCEPTVYVVDDDRSTRDVLRRLIESISLRAETFCSCEEFLEDYAPNKPGCIVLDVRLPGMSGFELQEWLTAQGDGIPIIMITGYGDVSMAVRAIENGAVDFLTKPFNDQAILDRIRQALDRDATIRQRRARTQVIRERFAALTQREREVMVLVIEGKANKVIAAELGISCKTIEGHRARVMEKMSADSLAGLVRMGLTLELTGIDLGTRSGERARPLPIA